MVVLGQLHGEVVRHQLALTVEQLGLGVEFALQARGDLDGLDVALERAREDAVDGALQFFLDAIEDSHAPQSSGTPLRQAFGGRWC